MTDQSSTAIMCSECGEDCGHRTVEIEALRAALQAIVDFQPEFVELGESFGFEVAACEKCEIWRRKQHPIQRMCEDHVRRSYAVRDLNERHRNNQYLHMKDIARAVLRGDGNGSPENGA